MNHQWLRAARKLSTAYATVLLLTLILLAGSLAAQQAQGLAGKWKMVSTTSSDDVVDWTLTLKQEGDTWTATVSGEDGDAPAKDVKVDGNSLHMKTPYGGEFYDVDVTLEGSKLTGKWSGNGDSGPTTGTRIVDSAAK